MFQTIKKLLRGGPASAPPATSPASASTATPTPAPASPHPKESNLRAAKKAWQTGATSVTHRPLMLQVEVTSHCNIDCIQCARVYDPRYDRKTGQMGMLSMDTFRRLEPILPDIAECYLWGNGEAMVHPEFLDMVEILKRHDIVITFNTHGMFLKGGKERRLVDLGVEGITISIDGATRETYNRIRVGSDFDLVTGNIRAMTAYKREVGSSKPILSTTFVVMSNNVHELAEMVRVAADIGLENVHFEPLAWNNDWVYHIKVFRPLHLSGNVPPERIAEHFREAVAEGRRLGIPVTSQFLDAKGEFDPRLLEAHEPRMEPTGEMPDVLFAEAASCGSGEGTAPPGASTNSASEKRERARAFAEVNRAEGVVRDPTYGLDPKAFSSIPFNGRSAVCAEPYTTIFLTWGGDVRTCCEGEKCFGNLERDGIEALWFGGEWERFRAALRDGPPPAECVKCLLNGRQKIQFREIEQCVRAVAAKGA